MKKVLKYFLLVLMFIPFIKVKAYVSININLKSDNAQNIYWFAPLNSRQNLNALTYPDGKVRVVNGEGVIHYQTKLYEGQIGNSEKFTAVCIDPGMKHSSGTFNCTEYNNADMVGLFKEHSSSNDATFITAVRIKAKRQSITTPSYANAMEVFDNNFSNFGEGTKNEVKKGVRSPNGILSKALEMANKTYGSGKAESNSSATFTSTVSSYSGNEVTVDITSSKNLLKVPVIECTYGCEGKPIVNWSAGSNSGKVTLKLKVPNPCRARLKIKYVTTDDGGGHLYYCSPSGTTPIPGVSGSDEQKFLAYISDKALKGASSVEDGETPTPGDETCVDCLEETIEVEPPEAFKNESCDNDCECNINTEKHKEIHFCCSESTSSTVNEPKINEIFCTKKKDCGSAYKIEVPGANDKETGKVDSESYNVPNTSYCRVYCTERIKVDIPGALEGHNGRYFKLEGAGGQKGPIISGSFGCRNVIDYDEWLMDYIRLNENAVEKYNEYQKSRTYYDLYKKAFEDNRPGNDSYKVKYSYKSTLSYTVPNVDTYTCDVTDSNDCTVTFNYDRHFTTSLSANYLTAKIKYENSKNTVEGFSKFEVVKDSQESVSTLTGYYHIYNKSTCTAPGASEKNCTISASDICLDNLSPCTHPTSDVVLTGTPELESTNNDEEPKDIKNDVNAVYNPDNPTSYISSRATSFNNSVKEIKNKKEEIDKCDNYFDEDSDDYKNFLLKKFQVPNVTFQWFFTYISVDSVVQPKINEVVYKLTDDSGSDCGLAASGEWKGGMDAETGVEAPHTDILNNTKVGTYITFDKEIDFNSYCNNGAEKCSGGLSENKLKDLRNELTAPQKYTSDTKFNYTCKYEPPTSETKYTVYPYGGFSLSQSNDIRAYTKYENQLYVEFSTLSGRYETNWLFSHLGSKKYDGSGKFDEDFTNGQDCTGNNPNNDIPMLSCELSVSRTLTKIKGCRDIASIFDNDSYWKNKCCTTPNCKSLTDDVLSFSFKVVDSKIIFPGTNRTGGGNSYQSSDKPKGYSLDENGRKSSEMKGYAANWFDDDIARDNLKYIEDHSGNDVEFSPDRLTYRFNLTSAAINAIRKYNHLEQNEFNRLKGGSYKVTTDDYVGKYESEFITNYYKGFIEANGRINLKNNTNGGTSARNAAREKVVWAGEKASEKF
ncbi:MAG: hypothetical protein IJS56_06475 [Bacilli bacterium]|nr:hypothetical protein [Bacilli bacterium]